jgi:thiol-disulfide isomerase/thioredoxin
MSATPSKMIRLGTGAPAFSLPEVRSGALIGLDSFAAGQPLLVMFICRHCPYVVHVQGELARLGRDYAGRVGIVAISANSVAASPADAPAELSRMATELDFAFPYCFDETQDMARAYGAACTPDFFLFDNARQLAYRGQLDDSRPGNGRAVTGADLRAALDALLAGNTPSADQRPSLGCNIKWK